MNGVSFGGLATGLPPNLVEQLMEAERAPVYRFQQRISKLKATDKAWGEVNTKVSSLRSATNDLLLKGDWNELWKASSSNEDAIGVSLTGTPTTGGSLSFTVSQLAQKQSQTSADTFASLDASLGGRTLSINGTDVTPTTDSLQALVDKINGDDTLGVTARAVQVTSGQYQLQLTAAESGTANAFTVTSGGWSNPWTEVQSAQDAVMDVDGLTVTRSSNTFDDLVEGVEITLKSVTADPVDVSLDRDSETTTERVKAFVDGLNGVLNEIKNKTRVGAEGAGSVLTGDSEARRIASQLTNALLRAGDDSTLSVFEAGIQITREGTFTLDESKLATALADDFEGVQALFTRASTSASPADVRLVTSDPSTTQGTYGVDIVTAAAKASVTGTGTDSPLGETTLDFTTSDGGSASITIAGGTSLTDAVAQINTALADAGIDTVVASDSGGSLAFEETRYGSRSFTVNSTNLDPYGVAGTFTGTDVVVEVEGQQFTGDGRAVTINDGPASGLELEVAGAAGIVVSVTVSEGLAGLMDLTLDGIEGRNGSIARARGSLDGRIDDFNDRIEVFERRLEKREEMLRRQFAALESTIGQMNNTSQWLSSQIAGLPSAR